MASVATHFSLFTIALLSFSCLSQSQNHKPKHSPFILPIGKDPITKLFYTSVGIGTPRKNFNLAIDLGGPSIWYDCNKHYNSSSYHHLPCNSKLCPKDSSCMHCDGPWKPGCTKNTCVANIFNPLPGAIFSGNRGDDVLFISHSIVYGLQSACTDTAAFSSDLAPLNGLPKTAKGILGLARTQLALPTQISSSHKLPRKFSLCLPSSNKKGLGILFIGGAPQNISSIFMRPTRLIVNPFSTFPAFSPVEHSYDYFIDVNFITVGGLVIKFKSSLLSIDKKGNGGTRLSTMNSFTVLHDSIYKPLVQLFVKQAADRKMRKVASVAPFGACFDLSTIERSTMGLEVPNIILELEGGLQWTIFGANSMVLVNKKVACLGFVNGGKEPRTSFVIGSHILEDNLLEFDLDSSVLNFSSSLLQFNARCSNFRS